MHQLRLGQMQAGSLHHGCMHAADKNATPLSRCVSSRGVSMNQHCPLKSDYRQQIRRRPALAATDSRQADNQPSIAGVAASSPGFSLAGTGSQQQLQHSMKHAQQELLRWQAQRGSGVLLTAALTASLPPGNIADILCNRTFVIGFWAWLSAQTLKIFTKRYKKGIWDVLSVFESGGMPSSHSSLCCSVTTAVACQYGYGSPLFAACICFSLIVMYDAMGVRRHAGKQAEVLNQVIKRIEAQHPEVAKVKLKEVLGHTPRQVICGGILGVLVAIFLPA